MKHKLPVEQVCGPFAPIAEPRAYTPDGRLACDTDEYTTLFTREELAAYIERLRKALEGWPQG